MRHDVRLQDELASKQMLHFATFSTINQLRPPFHHQLHHTNQYHTKMAIIDPDQLLPLLTSEEKIKLLSGDDMWHTVAIPRLDIPRVRVSNLNVKWVGYG